MKEILIFTLLIATNNLVFSQQIKYVDIEELYIRHIPDINAPKIGTLFLGDSIQVLSDTLGIWSKITYKNTFHYVLNNDLINNKADIGKIKSSYTKSTREKKQESPNPSYQTIYTGPRGGKYYINSKGNKTYIKH